MSKKNLTNASPTKNGYNYQDVIAIIFFIDHINELKSIEDEGKGDVDLIYNDGSISYIQAKCTQNVFSKNRTEALKTALRDLINKFSLEPEPKKIFYVTNSHYPFGDEKQFDFISNHSKYYYNDFNDSVKNKMKKQITYIKNEYKRRNKKIDKFIYKANNKEINTFLNKLYVVKFAFEGADYETKLNLAKYYMFIFLKKIGMSEYYKRIAFDKLYTRINISSGSNKRHFLNKEDIMSEMFILYTKTNDDYERFMEYCNIDFDEENTIKDGANEFKDLFINNYKYEETIMGMYINYSRSKMGTPYEKLGNFVNENLNKLCKVININKKDIDDKKDIFKYIFWIMISRHGKLNEIVEACSHEN